MLSTCMHIYTCTYIISAFCLAAGLPHVREVLAEQFTIINKAPLTSEVRTTPTEGDGVVVYDIVKHQT